MAFDGHSTVAPFPTTRKAPFKSRPLSDHHSPPEGVASLLVEDARRKEAWACEFRGKFEQWLGVEMTTLAAIMDVLEEEGHPGLWEKVEARMNTNYASGAVAVGLVRKIISDRRGRPLK
jgi:hypothetical protein